MELNNELENSINFSSLLLVKYFYFLKWRFPTPKSLALKSKLPSAAKGLSVKGPSATEPAAIQQIATANKITTDLIISDSKVWNIEPQLIGTFKFNGIYT